MYVTLLRRAERYSSRETLGMGLRIPITNCCYSGSLCLLAWTAFSVTPALRPACRQSSSLESRSTRLAFYRALAGRHGLQCESLGPLAAFGHGVPGENHYMLKFSTARPSAV